MKKLVRLQILVASFGIEGLQRLARSSYPAIPEVEYLVSCQTGERPVPTPDMIPEQLRRPDMKIHFIRGFGSAPNRNHLLDMATAPLALISDDDLVYDSAGISRLIAAFDEHPEIDFATFRFPQNPNLKNYPDCEFEFSHIPRGFWITNFELALRPTAYKKIRFDERFGVNCLFPAGEEDIFLLRLLKGGFKGRYFPVTLGEHPHATTAVRLALDPGFIGAKGVVTSLYHPFTYPLRIWLHARRYSALHPEITPKKYRRLAFDGIRTFRQSETKKSPK